MNVKRMIRKELGPPTRPLRYWIRKQLITRNAKREVQRLEQILRQPISRGRIFYLGVTEHANMGDLAQHYCINRWIETYCSDYDCYKFESSVVVHPRFGFVEKLSSAWADNDLIIFQSGYCTQDLGGDHELMHRMIADAIPQAKVLMMPQTIFFASEQNRARTSISYDNCRQMVFLARDEYSYAQAVKMFPHLAVYAYPDIVTSLIGEYSFDTTREKIFLCRRNDSEKYYAECDLLQLRDRLSELAPVDMGDTQGATDYRVMRKNLKQYIDAEIAKYAHYKVVVTDRYHGTIFSLAAGTPVVIIKTTDHKVTTGADWFKGIYDGHVYVAQSLDEAYQLARQIVEEGRATKLQPYFAEQYYGAALRRLFDKHFHASK